jgi:DNA-binding NarL/FixJ family response regulator
VPPAGDLPAFGEATTLLHQAVRHYHAAGLRHDEAEARLLLARALMAEGDREAARDQIASATDVLTDLADTVGLQQAADLAQCLDRRDPGPLTPREQEVLRLVSRGMSNDEIATALTLSTHTVHRHVANILAKLNEPTRASAVSHALSRSLI